MTHLLAEGGYQAFLLSNTEKTWLYFALVCAVASIVVGLLLVRGVLAADQGTASMKDIAKAVQEGAEAFLSRQFKTILIIVVPLAVLIFFTATKVTHTVTHVACSAARWWQPSTPWWTSPSPRPGSTGSSASSPAPCARASPVSSG